MKYMSKLANGNAAYIFIDNENETYTVREEWKGIVQREDTTSRDEAHAIFQRCLYQYGYSPVSKD